MLKVKNITSFFIFLLCSHVLIAQVDSPPEITAIGRQPFCYGSPINIVTDFTISDIDDTGIPVFFVQISEGYQIGFDFLEIVGNFPTIVSSWDANAAKLTLTPSGILSEIPLLDLENAIKNIVFTTSATNVVSEKSFSLTTENANYLPLTDHFYEFVPDDGITWSAAKVAAEARTYFGREGYLATLTTQEEADFAGKQATGTGWIGGSDEETEGVWKWVTGPEAGTIFWNGQVGGTTPTFANWNENEPNDFGAGGEDYAHITDPSIGIRGAWNDLSNTGGTDLYLPRGYIVEYGKPGDPALNIVASTSIYIPQITSITEAVVCESEIATISAIPSEGDILWHDNPNRGTTPALATGNSYTVSVTETTTFYATVTLNGCITGERIPVTVTVNQRPTITSTTDDEICDGVAELFAVPSAGEVFWYDSLTSTTALATGEYFRTPPISESTTYYVEAEIAGSSCNSLIRTAVNAIVNPIIPSFEIERRQYALCEDIGEVELRTINPQDNYTYFWTKDGNSFSGNSATITVREVGVYAVKAISTAGCESREQTIEVVTSEIATITNDDVLIMDNSNNNSIEIITDNLGIGDYIFAIDDINGFYQQETKFENLTVGLHTLYVKDRNGCGTQEYQFSILNYPKFFSPNNDGINDYWTVKGFDSSLFEEMTVIIYNRFGKVIHKIDPTTLGWNGTYNGRILPSSNYWFSVKAVSTNGRIIESSGNFSLVR